MDIVFQLALVWITLWTVAAITFFLTTVDFSTVGFATTTVRVETEDVLADTLDDTRMLVQCCGDQPEALEPVLHVRWGKGLFIRMVCARCGLPHQTIHPPEST